MKILIFSLIMGLGTELSAQKLKSQNHNKSNSTERLIAAGSKVVNSLPTCNICSGRGKVTCSNCSDWSSEYKRKRACDYCKDTRKVNCFVCGGSGKFIQRELILSQEDLDAYIDKNSEMSASSKYPMRPIEPRVKYVGIFNTHNMKIDSAKDQEEEDSRYNNFIELEVKKGHYTREQITDIVKKQRENDKKLGGTIVTNTSTTPTSAPVSTTPGIAPLSTPTQVESSTNERVIQLKSFFDSDSFNITVDQSNYNLIKIIKSGSNNIINLSTYKIKNGFIIDNDNGSVYNKYGNLVYKGNAIYNTLQFIKVNGEKKSYLFFNFYDESESSYRNILGDYRGETILNQLDNDKIKLYLVSATNELEEFDISKYRNNRLLVTRFYSESTNDLANIQYEYQITDLETATKSKMIQERNLKKNINKIQKKIGSMADAFKSALS